MAKIGYGWHKVLAAIGAWMVVAGAYASTEAGDLLSERIRLSGAIRFQWSDRDGRQLGDGFETRLARLAANFQLDEQLSGRLMVEFASGDRATNAELFDAYVVWRPHARLSVSAGQQLTPIFYDGRERVPQLDALERAEVVGVYLQGVRGRGVFASYALEPRYQIQVGLWNSLTFRDPQLVGRGGQAAVMGSLNIQATLNAYQLNIGGLAGRRPSFTTVSESNTPLNVPDTERWLWYVEQEWRTAGGLGLRWSYVRGRDRNPAGGVSNPRFLTPSDFQSNIVYVRYTLNPRHQLVARWEDFDPDLNRSGDSVRVLGLFYHHFPAGGVRLTAAYEWLRGGNRQNRVYLAAQYQF